jgi:hypothetical protein
LTVQQLQSLAVLLNVERSGEKGALATRISEYLRSPKDLGASKPAPRKSTTTKKKSVAAKGKKRKAAGSKRRSAPKKAKELSEAAIASDSEDEEIIAEVSKEVGGDHKH